MRLRRRPLGSRNGAVLKIWHRVTYDSRKRTDLVSIRAQLRNRVDRTFSLSLGSVAVSEWNQILLATRIVTPSVIHSQTNRQIWAGDIRITCRDLLNSWNG